MMGGSDANKRPANDDRTAVMLLIARGGLLGYRRLW
jgi:hypothetical protein